MLAFKNMSDKSIRYIAFGIKIGLFILPVLSLIVAESFFFPFITGKNFFFRIGVEILFFFWIFIACFSKNYRPAKSPIVVALAATLFFLALATIFGANPSRSFWSNYERMEGLIGHIHLFLYFLILTSVFRKKEDWEWLFRVSIGVSVILTIYGFLQFFGIFSIHQGDIRLDATLGNATYFAILLIFHIFLIGLLFIKTKNQLFRSILLVLAAAELFMVFATATRGAILGFLGGSLIFAIMATILNFKNNKKIRNAGLGFFGFLALMVISFLLFKNTSFVRNNYALTRLASISLQETTTDSRLTIWKMSFHGFLERPFFGWGPENYNLVFNKYFEPKLYRQEPWFDRAHNIVFDWLISGGILGFLAYWSIWAAAIFAVIRLFRKKRFTWSETALFFAVFAAYAFHNLFVFDNLTSYFLFFTILGYLHFRYKDEVPEEGEIPAKEEPIGILSYAIIVLAFLAVTFSLYFLNLKPILANRQLLGTLNSMRVKGADVDFMLKEFDKVFSYKTFGSIEAREQLAGYADQILSSPNISPEAKNKVAEKTIQEMKNQIIVSPNDARAYIFLSSIYTKAGLFDKALQTVIKAIEFSPKKQQIRFALADVYLSTGQNEKALDVLREAYELDKNYPEAAKNFLIVAIISNRQNLIEKISEDAKKAGMEFGDERQFINAYARAGNYKKVKELWLAILEKEPNNAQVHVSMAATYLQLGERNNAIKELEKAAELNPEFKQQAEYYINEIKAGRNP